MLAKIKVKDRQEARLIRNGLEDKATRATVKIVGAIIHLRPDARIRVLRFVEDKMRCEVKAPTDA